MSALRLIQGSKPARLAQQDDGIVYGQIDNGAIHFMLVGAKSNRVPDMIRLSPPGHWRPSIHRRPDESGEAFWQRVVTAIITLRHEKIAAGGPAASHPLPLYCFYGVPFVDEAAAEHNDMRTALRGLFRAALIHPDASPAARLEAARALHKLFK